MNKACLGKIELLLKEKGTVRQNGSRASARTREATREVVLSAFRLLHELGFRLESPQALRQKHIRALVRHWWLEKKLSPKTLQHNLSRLRQFARMMNRPQIIGQVTDYLPEVDPALLKVEVAARKSRAPASAKIDMTELFRVADEKDTRLGSMLRMELHFGLRRMETLKFNPHLQDRGTHIEIFPGQAKGGRPRLIAIQNEADRSALDLVKNRTPKGEVLGWPFQDNGAVASLHQNIRRYEYLLRSIGLSKKDLGVTGHGLRAQFAENRMLKAELLPGVLGGDGSDLESCELDIRRTRISEELGHGRKEILASYVGSTGSNGKADSKERAKARIQAAVLSMGKDLPSVPTDRQDTCAKLLVQLENEGLELNLRQVHLLWVNWSRRCGIEWDNNPGEHVFLLLASYSV